MKYLKLYEKFESETKLTLVPDLFKCLKDSGIEMGEAVFWNPTNSSDG